MTHAITTLDDTELDAVCGGHGLSIVGVVNTFNINSIVQRATNNSTVVGAALFAISQSNVQAASIG
jgi:hypothetical protein